MSRRAQKSGFTLIELLVVIAIIGLLSSVVLASLSSSRKNARNAQRVHEAQDYGKAAETYYVSAREYPKRTAANVGTVRCLGMDATETCGGTIAGEPTINSDFVQVMSTSTLYRGVDVGLPVTYTGYRYNCLGAGTTNAVCQGFSILFVLEGANASCGGNLTVNPSLGGAYTYCQIIRCPIGENPVRSGNSVSTYTCAPA